MASTCLPAAAELMKEFYYFIAPEDQINACFALQIRKEPSSSSLARQSMVGPGLLLRIFVHSSLLRATLFHFLTSNILMSWSTPSFHRSFGLPTLLTPSGLALNIFLMVLSLFIRIRCPAHASLLTLTHCGPVTQICVFTLQLRKTDDANLRF